jgi:hypothetical protein
MGSKRSLAPIIAERISKYHEGAILVDAFAGTCAVGAAAARRHRIYANDIHAFAEVIARALLVTTARFPLPSEAWEDLYPAYMRNRERLDAALSARLNEEAKILATIKRKGNWKLLKEFSNRELCMLPAIWRGADEKDNITRRLEAATIQAASR